MLAGKQEGVMPITKRPRRPVDVVSNAVHMMKVLTGEAEDTPTDYGKDEAAQAMGKKGGMRARRLWRRNVGRNHKKCRSKSL